MLKLGNPYAPYNPLAPVDWLLSPLDRLTGTLTTGLGAALLWLLSQVPPGLGYFGYIVFVIWLAGWVSRHVRMIPLNPASPMFGQPGGTRLWMHLSWFRVLLVIGVAGFGAYIPALAASTIWRDPNPTITDTLGPMGRLAELVGLVCGFRIAWRCQYQLNLLMVIGFVGWALLSVAGWVFGS
jgi:hypothetical protein